MKKSITKKQIMRALKDEPLLKRKEWFQSTSDVEGVNFSVLRYNKIDCAVCAVGCVLRAMSFEKWARQRKLSLNSLGIRAIAFSPLDRVVARSIKENLRRKNYLSALSRYFEGGKTREQCIAFVNKNFPSKLTLVIEDGGVK